MGAVEDLAADAVAFAVALSRGAVLDCGQVRRAIGALAEITDALALVSDHLARQLHNHPHTPALARVPDGGRTHEGLYVLRDLLAEASSRARVAGHDISDGLASGPSVD